MVLVAVLVFLLLRQVMPIASGLAGGIALSSFGTLSRFVSWGMRRGSASAGAVAALAGGSLAATGALAAQPLRVRRTVWHQS
jgi:type IV secretion system protein VirB6